MTQLIIMRTMFTWLMLLLLLGTVFTGCTNDDLTPVNEEQSPGKIIIRGYSALQDSIQLIANGKPLAIDGQNTFKGEITKDYEFVFYNGQPENIEIIDKGNGTILHSYDFPQNNLTDTLSFYVKEGIYIDDVLSFEPGILSANGRTGYRFIFPTLNRYSNSGYDGAIDAIIRKTNGEVLGIAENITKESFSNFIEFDFNAPPILNVELVKHGTTESYIQGQQVIVQMVMQNNRSKLIILNEKANENGEFIGVEGAINLTDYFDF